MLTNGPPIKNTFPQMWHIWSLEHNAWWGPGGNGYTTDHKYAGVYSIQEAVHIVTQANKYRPIDQPNESMIPVINQTL